ncbi:EthD domain-containing protein [Saccharomonospora saliphila]|uniref:EthD domain-containing protein n=1 Tax=Saccharomonospora saliphila TaxID=369829 RepID=UPI000362C8C2|nr:EthD domain-containing protein [Saccharomonospora saliphila]
MIHFFVLVPRAEGVSEQRFHDHWRHPHATLERLVPTARGYVLGHQTHTDLLGADQAEFGGVTEVAFDTVSDAAGFGGEAFYRRHVEPDEPAFADVSRLEWIDTVEEVLVPRASEDTDVPHADALWLHLDRPVTAKLMQFVRRGGDAGWAGSDDAELGRRIGALRHARNRPHPEVHGDDPPFLGVRQLWWPTITAFEDGARGDPEAFRRLLARAGDSVTLLVHAERYLRW